MTALTTYLSMCTVQNILGALVMIEIPQLPRSGVVASLTPLTELEFVMIVFFVTRITILRCVLVTSCLVTTLACRSDMAPGQWELGETVVKLLNFPIFVCVARATLFASLPFVFVVFFVAAVTFGSSFTITC